MGIKGLWTVLTPFSEKKSLHEIRGETLAVDLSGWVCDSQNVTDHQIQPRLYLRNLFFRTMYLLLVDVRPIFVLEGDAPELKRDVMAARNALQFRGTASRSDGNTKKRPNVARKRFRAVLNECESLLKCMGVSCVKGPGEAEATCAQLNLQGLVCAVVSQDSDCFAYGARRVYRNFSVSSAAGGGATHGSIDCYDADRMFKENGFGRNKMVALALLCGCDYGVGACGSSVVTVVNFLHTICNDEIIPRLLSWVSDPERYDELKHWVSVSGRCERCGHSGRHIKNGCYTCATNRGCNDTGHKSKLADVKRELSLRNRALTCGTSFPEPRIMKEFLDNVPAKIDSHKLMPSMPVLVPFVKLMGSKLDWPQRYCVEKFLPLLTRWHLTENVSNRSIQPLTIKKKRNPKGIPSYQVVWEDINGQYQGLIPDDQFADDEDPLSAWTTIERQDLMKEFYPKVVEAFEESIKKPPKEKKPRSRKKMDATVEIKPRRKYNKKSQKLFESILENLHKSIEQINVSTKDFANVPNKANISVSINKLKRKVKKNKLKNQRNIDSFVTKKRKLSKILIESLSNSLRDVSLHFLNVNNKQHCDMAKGNLEMNKHSLSFFNTTNDDISENEISDIVDKIISKAPRNKIATVNNDLVKLVFANNNFSPRKSGFRKSVLSDIQNNCSTPIQISARKNMQSIDACKVNTSYFFDKLTDECDVFELSTDFNLEEV